MTPTIRTDPLTGERVIIAQARGKRPNAAEGEASPKATDAEKARCPFCEGKEGETPAEVFAVGPEGRAPDSPDWSIRVFPNKFSALSAVHIEDLENDSPFQKNEGLEPGVERAAFGYHEVIVETPQHDARLDELSVEHLARVIGVFRTRIRRHYEDPGVEYVQVFKNEGKAAGASLPHPHTQLMALGFVPPRIERIAALHGQGSKRGGGCITCTHIERERESGKRIIFDEGGFLALTPFASRVPYEVAIFPVGHSERFETEGQDDQDLAHCIQAVLRKLRGVGQGAYNLVIRTSPAARAGAAEAGGGAPAPLHWCVEIFPRTTIFAGFELASGAYVNPVSPETAAEGLRKR